MPPVSGFRAYAPRAQTILHPFSGAVIATPVLDLVMTPTLTGVYADRTPYGNRGTIYNPITAGQVTSAPGVYDIAMNGNARGGAVAASSASLSFTGDTSMGMWLKPKPTAAASIILFEKYNGFPPFDGFFLGLPSIPNTARVYINGLAFATGVNIEAGRWQHLFITVGGSVLRGYVDGLQNYRAASNTPQVSGSPLLIGVASGMGLAGYSSNFDGSIELPQVYNGALSPEQVYRNYLQAKDVPIYYDTFESYAVTPVAKAVGSMCGPFMVALNTLLVGSDTEGKYVTGGAGVYGTGKMPLPEPFITGAIEFGFRRGTGATDYGAFVYDGSAAVNGYGWFLTAAGNFVLYRYTAGGVAAIPISVAITITTGVDYKLRVVRRIGGVWTFYLKGGAYPDWALIGGPAVDATHNLTNIFFTPYLFGANRISGLAQSRVCERPASFPWEFSTGAYDGLVSGSTIWMRCLTAGVTYLPKDLDWQTCTFKLYKGADANQTDVLFVASEIGGSTFANQNGYVLRLAADESVQLIRTTGGIEAAPTAQTAAGFVSITTEYEFKITHNGTTNAYEFYIMGGAYATWTLMFAATLGIHVTSNYTTWDMDADDRTTAPQFFTDLR